MGGLRKYQPITHLVFLIACLAIAGIPPFAGFFSKDEILAAAWAASPAFFAVGATAAALTAFYMFRLYFLVFWNANRTYSHTPHESPGIMLAPMIILAFGSVVAGFIPFGRFVSSDGIPLEPHLDLTVAGISVAVAIVGIGLAWTMYKSPTALPERMAGSFKGFYQAALKKFYIDEIYLFITKNIIFRLISRSIAWFDRQVIDALVDFIATVTNKVSAEIRGLQSGQLQHYAFIFLSGIILIVLVIIYTNA
jgi:NADH-quinone oxidoreductase subunit L